MKVSQYNADGGLEQIEHAARPTSHGRQGDGGGARGKLVITVRG